MRKLCTAFLNSVFIGILFLGFFSATQLHAAFVSPGAPTNYVTDFANILSEETENQLNAKLQSFDTETSTQIFVATVNSLEGNDISEYAVELGREWKIGTTENNGLLILVAPNERKVWIATGYGLEGIYPDALTQQVIQNNILPRFKEGNYDQGVIAGVDASISIVKGETFDVTPADSGNLLQKLLKGIFSNIEFVFIFVFLFGQFLISTLASSKSWWLGGVIGAAAGVIIGVAFGFLFAGVIGIILLTISGLVLDYFVSKSGWGKRTGRNGNNWIVWGGPGGSSSGFGGGSSFGGGGGGSFGGGGSGGSW